MLRRLFQRYFAVTPAASHDTPACRFERLSCRLLHGWLLRLFLDNCCRHFLMPLPAFLFPSRHYGLFRCVMPLMPATDI